jgi:hypothetical protein
MKLIGGFIDSMCLDRLSSSIPRSSTTQETPTVGNNKADRWLDWLHVLSLTSLLRPKVFNDTVRLPRLASKPIGG